MPRNTELSDKDRAQIAAAYKRGEKVTEMAKRLGINRSTIYWVLEQQGIQPDRMARPEAATTDTALLALENSKRLDRVEGRMDDLLKDLGRLSGLLEGITARLGKAEELGRRIHPNEWK